MVDIKTNATERKHKSAAVLLILTTVFAALVSMHAINAKDGYNDIFKYSNPLNTEKKDRQVRVAFIGNSIFYFNDTPRLFERLARKVRVDATAETSRSDTSLVVQDSCLRGGASFPSHLQAGNGMSQIFRGPNALLPDGTYDIGSPTIQSLLLGEEKKSDVHTKKWDFVAMHDQSQVPAREKFRQKSIHALTTEYAPMFIASGATPVFLVTAAYRAPTFGSDDLGDINEFTSRLMEGYQLYARAIGELLPPSQKPKVAPLALAYLKVHEENIDLWAKLFHTDGFHPSPHGSYLQGCILYCTIFGRPPSRDVAVPENPSSLWDRARIMQPPEEPALPRPTVAELKYLLDVANRVHVSYTSSQES